MSESKYKIFVTVGTQKFQFNRLIEKIDSLVEKKIISDDVFAQIGYSDYKPKSIKYKKFLDQIEFKRIMDECDIIITHGGTGVIVNAIKQGKKVIGIPRKKELGEHVDNHQYELITQFSDKNFIIKCDDIEQLQNSIQKVKAFIPQKYVSNSQIYINELDKYLQSLSYKKNGKNKNKFSKIKKYYEYLTTKITVKFKQKQFLYNDFKLHYMYEKNQSDVMAFVFSSCTRIGIKARYNYVKTMKTFNIDKMFILDDFGFDSRGAFYLGTNMDFRIEKGVISLINKTLSQGNYKKVLFIGSSKGGYAALNFGLKIPDSIIISGAPQFRLGNYLIDVSNQLENTLKYISGKGYSDISQNLVDILNKHLELTIKKCAKEKCGNKIYLHYSDKEHTYEEHIKELIEYLNQYKYKLIQDKQDYSNHSDISLYFPEFIKDCLNKEV